MKSNKGFTLIELLAVIVILAIIALIATPTILSVIETARKGSAESSALGYIDALEKQVAIDMLEDDSEKKLNISGSSISLKEGKTLEVKGTVPEKESVYTYNAAKGTIGDSCLIVKLNENYYPIKYTESNGKATAAEAQKAVADIDTSKCAKKTA